MKIAALLMIVTALAACSNGQPDDARPESNGASTAGALSLRVMTFNIEWGGTHVRFAGNADAIRAADADIVGILLEDDGFEILAESAFFIVE